MKRQFFYWSILLLFACKAKPGAEQSSASTGRDSGEPKAKELLNIDHPASARDGWTTQYLEQQNLATKKFAVSIQSRFYLPDSLKASPSTSDQYFTGNILIVRDASTKVADTMEMESHHGQISSFKIEDMSDSLKFSTLVLQLQYPGDSDIPTSEFIEYEKGKFKNLFVVEWLDSLQRKDHNTLAGVVRYTDEVVYGKIQIPVTISLADGSVKEHIPDIQYIGNPSKTLLPLKVYRHKGSRLTEPFTIKTGTLLTIDTFYRRQNIVRMMVADSIPVYIRLDDIGNRITKNTAG